MTISLPVYSVTFPFLFSQDAQLDKIATQIMTNKAIVNLSLSGSFPFHHLSIGGRKDWKLSGLGILNANRQASS